VVGFLETSAQGCGIINYCTIDNDGLGVAWLSKIQLMMKKK